MPFNLPAKGSILKIGMYDTVPNFGDVLNNYLWQPYFGEFIGRDDNILMMGIGTLLGHKRNNEGPVIVCGSGSGYGGDFSQITNPSWKFFFVRGPLTAGVLGLPESMAITDPAILTPEIFPPAPKTEKIIFVPHWETSLNPLWKTVCKHAGVEYIDPLGDIADIMKAISGAKLVIAEAMHAAIIADSYRVPWVSVSTTRRINAFKWQDWAKSLNMTHSFQYYAPLGLSAQIQNLSAGRAEIFVRQEKAIASGLQTQNAAPLQKLSSGGGGAVRIARKIYKAVTPKSWQGGKYLEVLSAVANKADNSLDKVLSIGVYNKFFDRAVADVIASSKTQGMLSADDVHAAKKAAMLEKFGEIRAYLASYPEIGK